MNILIIPDEVITGRIYLIRGQKVMLDRDLALLYSVETKVLKQAVRRNIERFPEDFMFEMTGKELEDWRSQIVTSSADRQGLRHAPFCFTEQGLTMLSCILTSATAIRVNIQIIRVFTKMREVLLINKDIVTQLEGLENILLKQEHYQKKQQEEIQLIFEYLKQLLHPAEEPRPQIGFKHKK